MQRLQGATVLIRCFLSGPNPRLPAGRFPFFPLIFSMAASPYRRFSSICPAIQTLVVRLIQEEFTPYLSLSADVSATAWARAVALADPTFLYCTAAEPTVRLCPESYQQLQALLQRELTKTE